jgi:hypothetical protein
MVCGTKVSIDAQVMAEGYPKLLREQGPTIGNDTLKYASAL